VIALGAIVRGETTHHEVLGHAVASALAALSTQGRPIGFGLLTCDTMEQARARSEKGREAVEAAIEMARLRHAMLRPSKAKRERLVPRASKSSDHPIIRSPDPRKR
jgi:hypothetical protein